MAEGVTHISLPTHKNTIEGDRRKQKDKRTRAKLGVNQEQRKVCNTTCMCRLSLAWVTSENSTSNSNADILRLFLTHCRWTLSHAASPLCSGVQPPTALYWVTSSTLIRVPLPLPDTARFHVQESFVWFRAKTDSSALAAYPHSATTEVAYTFQSSQKKC